MIHHWHCGRKYLWSLRFAATSSCVLCLHTWFSHVFTIGTFLNGDVIHLALKFWCRRLGLIPGWCFCSKLRRTVWCLVSAWLPLSTSSNAQRWGLHLTWILSRRHSVWAWPDVTRSVHGWARLGRFVASLTIARGLWLDLLRLTGKGLRKSPMPGAGTAAKFFCGVRGHGLGAHAPPARSPHEPQAWQCHGPNATSRSLLSMLVEGLRNFRYTNDISVKFQFSKVKSQFSKVAVQ